MQGEFGGSAPYSAWQSTGSINGQKFVQVVWNEEVTQIAEKIPDINDSDVQGNVTISMTLVPVGTEANVTAMTVDFDPSSGVAVNYADTFVQTDGKLLYQELSDLSGDFLSAGNQDCLFTGTDAAYLEAVGCGIQAASLAIADLSSYLDNSSNSFYGIGTVLVSHIATYSISFTGTPQCFEAAIEAGGVEAVLSMLAVPELEAAVSFMHGYLGVYGIFDVSSQCWNYAYG